jgi:hypothetical protein
MKVKLIKLIPIIPLISFSFSSLYFLTSCNKTESHYDLVLNGPLNTTVNGDVYSTISWNDKPLTNSFPFLTGPSSFSNVPSNISIENNWNQEGYQVIHIHGNSVGDGQCQFNWTVAYDWNNKGTFKTDSGILFINFSVN